MRLLLDYGIFINKYLNILINYYNYIKESSEDEQEDNPIENNVDLVEQNKIENQIIEPASPKVQSFLPYSSLKLPTNEGKSDSKIKILYGSTNDIGKEANEGKNTLEANKLKFQTISNNNNENNSNIRPISKSLHPNFNPNSFAKNTKFEDKSVTFYFKKLQLNIHGNINILLLQKQIPETIKRRTMIDVIKHIGNYNNKNVFIFRIINLINRNTPPE